MGAVAGISMLVALSGPTVGLDATAQYPFRVDPQSIPLADLLEGAPAGERIKVAVVVVPPDHPAGKNTAQQLQDHIRLALRAEPSIRSTRSFKHEETIKGRSDQQIALLAAQAGCHWTILVHLFPAPDTCEPIITRFHMLDANGEQQGTVESSQVVIPVCTEVKTVSTEAPGKEVHHRPFRRVGVETHKNPMLHLGGRTRQVVVDADDYPVPMETLLRGVSSTSSQRAIWRHLLASLLASSMPLVGMLVLPVVAVMGFAAGAAFPLAVGVGVEWSGVAREMGSLMIALGFLVALGAGVVVSMLVSAATVGGMGVCKFILERVSQLNIHHLDRIVAENNERAVDDSRRH